MNVKKYSKMLIKKYNFVIIPVKENMKVPLCSGWQNTKTGESYANIKASYEKNNNINIGIVCGKKSNIFVVDVDKDKKTGDLTYWEQMIYNNHRPKTMYQKTPSGGYHYIFEYEDRFDKFVGSTNINGTAIDLRTNGNQIVCDPSTTEKGKYTMYGESISKMPDWLYNWIFKNYKQTKIKHEFKHDIKHTKIESKLSTSKLWFYRKVIDCLDIKRSDDRDDWLKIGFALSSISKCSDMYDLYLSFSSKSAKFDQKACYDVFYSSKNIKNKINSGTLFYYANLDDSKKLRNVKHEFYYVLDDSEYNRYQFNYINTKYDRPEYESDLYYEAIKEIVKYLKYYIVSITGLPTLLYICVKYNKNSTRTFYYKGQNVKELFNGCCLKYKITTERTLKCKKLKVYDIFKNNFGMHWKTEITFQPDKNLVRSNQFNMFDKLAINKQEALLYSKYDVSPFLNHIKNIWCKNNPIKYNYVFNWFSWCLQKPSTKTKVALILQSSEGGGKGIIIDKFKKIYGDYYLHITDYTKILGNFNSCLENKLFCLLDEGVWGGNKQAVGKLKTFITEDTLIINKKNVSEYITDNRINMVINSNEDFIIPAGKTPRRYFMLELDSKLSGVQTQETKAHFDAVGKVESGAVANYFYNRDITGFNPRKIPKTESIQGQQTMNLDGIENFILQICTDGVAEISDDTEWYDKNHIYALYVECNKNKHTWNNASFWRKLNKILPYLSNVVNRRQKNVNGQKIRQIRIYNRNINQKCFRKYMGGTWLFLDDGKEIIKNDCDSDSESFESP